MGVKEEAIRDAIGRISGGKFIESSDAKELPSILWNDELPERIIAGSYAGGSGILVATNKRLLFVNKRLFGGLKVEDFPYEKMSSLEYGIGFGVGKISVHASGNSATIDMLDKTEVKEFAEYARARASGAIADKVPGRTAVVEGGTPASGLLEQLERLASLRQQGLLTDEEFALAKSKLLAS